MALYTNTKYISSSVPAYFAPGRYMHRISTDDGVNYNTRRVNRAKYRLNAKTGGPFADQASALAWCETDYALVRPAASGIAPTTTTAGYTQPAVGATVVVPVASATGLTVDMSVAIATGGTYQITAIAGLSLTLRNTGGASNAAPTTVIPTAQAVTAVAGPGL